MSKQVDCYFTPISPWAYLGMRRFRKLADATEARAAFKPVDISKIFASVGAVPVAQRPLAKQRNRIQELRRWSRYLSIPLHAEPRYFPTDPMPACRLIAAAILRGDDGAELAEACLSACWAEEKNIADSRTLAELAERCGYDGSKLLEAAKKEKTRRLIESYTDEALRRGVIGSPCYVIGEEVFFGQDRLDFVEWELRGEMAPLPDMDF